MAGQERSGCWATASSEYSVSTNRNEDIIDPVRALPVWGNLFQAELPTQQNKRSGPHKKIAVGRCPCLAELDARSGSVWRSCPQYAPIEGSKGSHKKQRTLGESPN